MKRILLSLLFAAVALQFTTAQTRGFMEGERVTTPDGRSGTIESFKMPDMAKVKFDDGTTKFYIRADLKKIEPPKPNNTNPPENFSVGDAVIDTSKPDTLRREGKIESISGDAVIVRTGPYKYDSFRANLKDLMSMQAWNRKQNAEKESKLDRAAFEDEAQPFRNTIRALAGAYDSKYPYEVQFTPEAATYQKFLKDLEGLAAVCQKYPNLTNESYADNPPYAGNFSYRQADWCKMARERERVVKNVQLFAVNQKVETEVGIWTSKIDQLLRNWNGWVKDDVQQLLFDRAAWEQKELGKAQKDYAAVGDKIPASALAPLDGKIAELKARIEQDAQTLQWEQPKYSDAAFEASVRAAYLKQYPGVKVFKTGMTFATWKAEDDTSLVGQGTGYKVYRTTKGAYRYKMGLALVHLPNQPFCQVRDFEFHQDKAGAGYGAARLTQPIAYAGMFVKCP